MRWMQDLHVLQCKTWVSIEDLSVDGRLECRLRTPVSIEDLSFCSGAIQWLCGVTNWGEGCLLESLSQLTTVVISCSMYCCVVMHIGLDRCLKLNNTPLHVCLPVLAECSVPARPPRLPQYSTAVLCMLYWHDMDFIAQIFDWNVRWYQDTQILMIHCQVANR